MNESQEKQFDFGRNWETYSLRVLDEERLAEARTSLEELIGAERIRGCRFLDIGSGSGMFSIAAAQLGAQEVVGVDVNRLCVEVAQGNAFRFCREGSVPRFVAGSALDQEKLLSLGRFDIVYAWGSLHHTGRMYRAVEVAAGSVAQGGLFVIAIYNRHFTSRVWRWIKWFYNHLPSFGRRMMAYVFAAIIFVAKFAVTFRNPLRKRRGMSFMVDVVDWIGGYPYEYASRGEIEEFVTRLGFSLEKFVPAPVPTGCNEFVFRRRQTKDDGR